MCGMTDVAVFVDVWRWMSIEEYVMTDVAGFMEVWGLISWNM